MTVLYILISTDPFGGATKSFMVLLHGVLKAGIKAIIVIPDNGGIYPVLCEMGAEVIIMPSKGCTWTGAKTLRQALLYLPRQLGRLFIDAKACNKLHEILKKRHIDLVHSNNTVTSLGRYIATKRNIPHLYHVREYGNKDFGLRYFPTNASFHKYLKCDNVYTICITKDIQRHHKLSQHPRSRVIYNGIAQCTNGLEHTHFPHDYFLYAGRIEPTKGLMELITAYEEYTKSTSSPLQLKVAGETFDSSYMQKIQEYIDSHHLQRYIIFLGKYSDMPQLYKSAKAIIIPSKHEGFGRCMPEAMSFGCIVIGHNTGGTKEQFDNGRSILGHDIGYPYNSSKELVQCLLHVHKSGEKELTLMRQEAYDTVCGLYSYDKYIQSVLEFYDTIVYKHL